MDDSLSMKEKIMANLTISGDQVQEYLNLYDQSLQELIITAGDLTQKHFDNKVEFCSIISAKTGKCPEDCAYCAQSSHHRTNCQNHDLLDIDTIISAAKNSRENGATRFCVVTSGKNVSNEDEFNKILEMVQAVSKINKLHSCCSLGTVSKEQAIALKEAGVERFNHNVNSAQSFYQKICSTHEYEERIQTVENLRDAGIEICCGGIIGMGETRRQRIEMALEIKALHPASVPLNFLIPIKGIPLENVNNDLTVEEILKTIAIYRIIMPDVLIRYAGGRTHYLGFEDQLKGLQAGINAMLVGNYLTTCGAEPQKDREMIHLAGKTLLED